MSSHKGEGVLGLRVKIHTNSFQKHSKKLRRCLLHDFHHLQSHFELSLHDNFPRSMLFIVRLLWFFHSYLLLLIIFPFRRSFFQEKERKWENIAIYLVSCFDVFVHPPPKHEKKTHPKSPNTDKAQRVKM